MAPPTIFGGNNRKFMSTLTMSSVTAVTARVHILDGNSEIGAHARSNLCYLICVRHLNRSRGVTNPFYFMRAQQVLGYHLI